MLGSDHKQTIAAVSRLAAFMERTGRGINHIFKGIFLLLCKHTYATCIASVVFPWCRFAFCFRTIHPACVAVYVDYCNTKYMRARRVGKKLIVSLGKSGEGWHVSKLRITC